MPVTPPHGTTMRDSIVRELRIAEQHGTDPRLIELLSAVLVPFADQFEKRREAGASSQQLVADTEIAAAAILSHLFLNARPRDVPLARGIGILCKNVEHRVRNSLLVEGVLGSVGTA